jgi:hypothetical protein
VAGLTSEIVSGGISHVDPLRLLVSSLIFLIYSFGGWLVALPFVILASNFSGRRIWVLAAVGILIGPAVILAFALYSRLTLGDGAGFWPGASDFLLFAAIISAASTFSYLLLIRYSARRSSDHAASSR